MKKTFFLSILIFLSAFLTGQEVNEKARYRKGGWTRKEWRSANTARYALYMSRQTRESIRFMNLSRMYGQKFADTYLDSVSENNGYVKSLINTLNKKKPVQPLRPSPNLWLAALPHAIISGIAASEGHQGYDLRLFLFQPFSYGNITGENCDYGARRGLDITLDLLIDEGVPSLGHRKNILSDDFTRVGGAIFLHREYTWNAVFDYSSPKWIDFIFYKKPDITQWGLNAEISQVSSGPMAGIGFAGMLNHIETTDMMFDLNYQHGMFENNLSALSGYLGYGSSTGRMTNFLIGAKVSSYFPGDKINLYLQPTLSYFAIISFLRHGYLFETNDNKNSAVYRFSYGYNFCINGNRNEMILKHNFTVSRFICIKSNAEKGKKKRK